MTARNEATQDANNIWARLSAPLPPPPPSSALTIRQRAYTKELAEAEGRIKAALWQADKKVVYDCHLNPKPLPAREAADIAIGKIREACAYYDAVKAEMEAGQ